MWPDLGAFFDRATPLNRAGQSGSRAFVSTRNTFSKQSRRLPCGGHTAFTFATRLTLTASPKFRWCPKYHWAADARGEILPLII